MKMKDFELELFFGEYEFTAPYLLCCSDCESMPLDELLTFEPGAKDNFLKAIAVRHREKLFARNRSIINENLSYSDEFFKKHESVFQYNRPMARPIAFHRLKLNMSAKDFCEDLVKQKGVLLAYGALFEKEGNYFRMGYGRKNYKVCLDLLDEYVSAL